ncbi:MAG: acetyl-CoA acetyltransferase [Epulopiscium sp. Nuni2H_MBin003]|nr:MAG: acetyl-CoA acetyltransferase [Epulopiscium sp. Nuni2H_MBin003]
MSKVYIVEAKRSAIGKFLGQLASIAPGDLAGQVIKQTLENLSIDKTKIDEVILGSVLPAGQGQGIARQASLLAGIPVEIPAYSVNMICGSGMKTVMTAYNAIKAGEANLIVAGGVEVMSKVPFVTDAAVRTGHKIGGMNLQDSIMTDGLLDSFNHYPMGITAENVAEEYKISREEQDEFAFWSQQKTVKSIDDGIFKEEIVPVEVTTRKGKHIFRTDEFPNRTTSLGALAKLRPAFKKGGTVTAGNATGMNDGASIIIVASEQAIKEYNLTPMAEIVSIGQGGVAPEVMGLGPVPAIKNALNKCNLNLKDMELIELNEAFAAQSIGVLKCLVEIYQDIDEEWIKQRINVNGGTIAIGHPLGASGARIITTLVHAMKQRNVTYGLASLCIGGGMGTCVVLKSI